MIYKNSYGVTAVLSDVIKKKFFSPFVGSALNRKKAGVKKINDGKNKRVKQNEKKTGRVMSPRTKSKIRKKIIALSQLRVRLTFLTLTFVNKVDDELAVIILRKFLDNVKKRSKNFQYLWVAEKQTKNKVFENNIHFHIISNKHWDINKYWKYWLELQEKHGILPRDKNFKATSAFDVRSIVSKNIKGVSNYLTKYVSKNTSVLSCQMWNCSKKISELYTGFYTDYSIIEKNADILENKEIKEIPLEYCNLFVIPLDEKTMELYTPLKEKNTRVWSTLADK